MSDVHQSSYDLSKCISWDAIISIVIVLYYLTLQDRLYLWICHNSVYLAITTLQQPIQVSDDVKIMMLRLAISLGQG